MSIAHAIKPTYTDDTFIDVKAELAKAQQATNAAWELMQKAAECVDRVTNNAQSDAESRSCGPDAEVVYRRCLRLKRRTDMATHDLAAIERLMDLD